MFFHLALILEQQIFSSILKGKFFEWFLLPSCFFEIQAGLNDRKPQKQPPKALVSAWQNKTKKISSSKII
jgi:hypothetical protein